MNNKRFLWVMISFFMAALLISCGSDDSSHHSKYLTGVKKITAGWSHSLALKNDGTIRSWGYNGSGQLGDGTMYNQNKPVKFKGLNKIKEIAAGWSHTVALKSDGTVWTIGNNSEGQLGDGTTEQKSAPVKVTGLFWLYMVPSPS